MQAVESKAIPPIETKLACDRELDESQHAAAQVSAAPASLICNTPKEKEKWTNLPAGARALPSVLVDLTSFRRRVEAQLALVLDGRRHPALPECLPQLEQAGAPDFQVV